MFIYVCLVFILYITYLLYHILENCTAKTWLICYFSFPLAAILIFNCSKRFKVCHHTQNKSPYHYTLILKISCFYPQNARFYDFWQLSKWTMSHERLSISISAWQVTSIIPKLWNGFYKHKVTGGLNEIYPQSPVCSRYVPGSWWYRHQPSTEPWTEWTVKILVEDEECADHSGWHRTILDRHRSPDSQAQRFITQPINGSVNRF